MAKTSLPSLDRDLEDLPPELRWRKWMARVEAVLFVAKEPVPGPVLAAIVGADANLDLLINDIQAELRPRPYEIVFTSGGYLLRTRAEVALAVQHALKPPFRELAPAEAAVLMTIAYYQPITRGEIGWIIGKKIAGKDVDSEVLAKLRRVVLIAIGPRSGEPGAPPMYVTTPEFLTETFCESLQDLPDWQRLEAEGLLNKEKMIAQRKALAKSMQAEASTGPAAADDEPPEPLLYD